MSISGNNISGSNVNPNSKISDTGNTGAPVKENSVLLTRVDEPNPGTNLANANNPTYRKVSATLVSSFGFGKGKAEIVENLMDKFCTEANGYLQGFLTEDTKVKGCFFDNLKTLFAKFVDFFKKNPTEIQKRQAEGWKQFENFTSLFDGEGQQAKDLRNEVLLPTFKDSNVEEQFTLLKMFQDKPEILSSLLSQPESKEILSSLLSQPESKEMINRCYHEMGAVNFYNTFKDHILNSEMLWLDKGFYIDRDLDAEKGKMTQEEKSKFLMAAHAVTKEQFKAGLEADQFSGRNLAHDTQQKIEKMISFLGEKEEASSSNLSIVLFRDLARQSQCSITIGNIKIDLLHSTQSKIVNEQEILEDLKQKVKAENLDGNAIKKLSEFLIKTPSQGYLAARLTTENGDFFNIPKGTCDKPFRFEVNLGEAPSVRVKDEGKSVISDCFVFRTTPSFVDKDNVIDYTLKLDDNDLCRVKSVQINKFEEKILGVRFP